MSDLTDNNFYPFAERKWLCIRFAKWACNRLTEASDFGINIICSDEAHFDLCEAHFDLVCKQAKLSHLGHRKLARMH